MTEQQLDRKDLKIQAYKERVVGLTSEYEEKVAELRVELTVTSGEKDEQIQSLNAEVIRLQGLLDTPVSEGHVVVSGEVESVQEEDSTTTK